MGLLSAGQGIFGAVSGFQQTQAQNAALLKNYKRELAIYKGKWLTEVSTYRNKKSDYYSQTSENSSAAGRAYAAEQTKLNEAYMSAAFQQQGALTELLNGRGAVAATGRTGRTAAKMDQAMLAAYGRNNATVAANLGSARNAMIRQNQQTWHEARSANNRAWSEVALAPVPGFAPPKPQMIDGRGQLAMGLLGAAVSGIGAFKSMKAPDAGNVNPSSSTSFSNAINMDLGMSPNFSNYSGIFSAPSSQGFNAFTMPSLPKLSNFSAQYSVPSQYTFR
jgi:hypothetical protein